MKIAVIDYGAGNLMSATKALQYLGFQTEIVSDPAMLSMADAMVLPGVGAFPRCMEMLRSRGLADAIIREAVQKPILGICLGMQMLMSESDEITPTVGLGLIPGTVRKIETAEKLPHIGWNSLKILNENPLTKNIHDGDFVYFVHTYCAHTERPDNLSMTTEYGAEVAAMVASGHVFGCQFHPEKSGDVGMTILKNFGELVL